MARPSCKDLLLDAAEAVVLEGGAGRLTLDAVAEKCGVSKGGLLYHFPTKDSLLEGMLNRLLEHSAAWRQETTSKLPEEPSRETKGEILAMLTKRERDQKVSAAMLAVVANQPQLMKSLCKFHDERLARQAEQGGNMERRILPLLAADGLFLLELLQLSPFSKDQRQKVVQELLRLVDEVRDES